MARRPVTWAAQPAPSTNPSRTKHQAPSTARSTKHPAPGTPRSVRSLPVMTAWPSVLHSAELGELTEDVRRLLQELSAASGSRSTAAGDCVPPLDVIETDEAVEILLDVP